MAEPISLDEAKAQLRIVDDTSQDTLIQSYIASARAYVESESGYIFVRRQFTDTFDAWPSYLSIARQPLISVDSVDYTDASGTTATVDEADYYTALLRRRVTPVSSWPTLGTGGQISVTYTAGFTDGEDVEEVKLARQAIMLLVATWYDNRSTVSMANLQSMEVPFGAKVLIDRFRAPVA